MSAAAALLRFVAGATLFLGVLAWLPNAAAEPLAGLALPSEGDDPACPPGQERTCEGEPRVEVSGNPQGQITIEASNGPPRVQAAAAPTVPGFLPSQVLSHPAVWVIPLAGIAVAFFHRLSGRRVLHHPLRAAIVEAARSRPGVLPADLARAHGVTLNAILHHVRVLEREGHVRVRRVGRAGLLFPASVPPVEREARAALRAPLARALLAYAHADAG